MFTCIGIFTSDSGKESILKFVLDKNGLSGMILFEQEEARKEIKTIIIQLGLQELNIA